VPDQTAAPSAADPRTDAELDRLLGEVLASVRTGDARLAEIARAAVTHLHAFVREVRPTDA
jgi:catechol 1,2-dioxygenase